MNSIYNENALTTAAKNAAKKVANKITGVPENSRITTDANGKTYKQYFSDTERKNVVNTAARLNNPDTKAGVADMCKKLKNIQATLKLINDRQEDAIPSRDRVSQRKGEAHDIKELNAQKREILDTIDKLGYKYKISGTAKNSTIRISNPVDPNEVYIIENGGNKNMYTVSDFKKMKVDVYEDASKGKISDNLKNYLLTYLERCIAEVNAKEAIMESVNEEVNTQKANFTEFVNASFEEGLITKKQHDIMLEMAEDDIMYDTEVVTVESVNADISALVDAYLEAADNNDEESKAEIKAALESAKEIKAVLEGGKDCGEIQSKLDELEIELTDDEKKIVKALDKKICDAQNGDAGEEAPVEDSKEDKKEDAPAEGGEEEVKECGELTKPISTGATDGETSARVAQLQADIARYKSNEQKMENEEKAEIKEVIADAPQPNQAPLSDDHTEIQGDVHLKGAITEYVEESVMNGMYSEEDAALIERYMGMM